MTLQSLPEAARWARDWLRCEALPLWQTSGFDAATGQFQESLDFAGKPLPVARRSRVQGRQMYTFAQATRLGWCSANEEVHAAWQGYHDFADPDGGYIFTLGRDGNPEDRHIYTYEAAFALLGLFSEFQLNGNSVALTEAQHLLAWLDVRLAHPEGGYFTGLTADGKVIRQPLIQNPHMHLLEAFLHGYQATQDTLWLKRAGEMIRLFERHFFDPRLGALREFFARDWSATHPTSRRLDPGHQVEWIWLLEQYGRATGQDSSHFYLPLYTFALGTLDPKVGLLCEEVTPENVPLKTSFRLWSQTELLKARLVLHHHRATPETAAAVLDSVNTMRQRHLSPVTPGLWMDSLSATGEPNSSSVPASTLYHLTVALVALTTTEAIPL